MIEAATLINDRVEMIISRYKDQYKVTSLAELPVEERAHIEGMWAASKYIWVNRNKVPQGLDNLDLTL